MQPGSGLQSIRSHVARGLPALAVVFGLLFLLGPLAQARAAELPATPDTFASVFASAQGGDTILLSSGDYGTFTGALKPAMVTIKAAPGATPTMAVDFSRAANITLDGMVVTDLNLGGAETKHITVRNSRFDQAQAVIHAGQLADADILFDHNAHIGFVKCANCSEARLQISDHGDQPSGITVRNSLFKGGNSDGIQNGAYGTQILDNEFVDIKQIDDASGVHADSIQLFGSKDTLVQGNYFHDVADGIMAPDNADHERILDNVFAVNGSPFAITLQSDQSSVVRHNTLLDGTCDFGLRCGIIRLGNKPGNPQSYGTTVMDNIASELCTCDQTSQSLVVNPVFEFNLLTQAIDPGFPATNWRGTPTYVGGASPATLPGFALTEDSDGRFGASDGDDVGAHVPGKPLDVGPPPTATIAAPVEGATFEQGRSVKADFSCDSVMAITSCTGPSAVDTATPGSHELTVTATDASGRTASQTVHYTVTPATDPLISVVTPVDGTTYEDDQGIRADYACSDADSGLRSCVGSAEPGQSVDMSVGSHEFEVTATDNAGHTATRTARYTVAPSAAPEISIVTPADGATYEEDQDIVADYGCSDGPGSGVAACDATPVDLTVGTHDFTVTASDRAGHHASKTVTYTVASASAPKISITGPADGASYEQDQLVKADYACAENDGVGVASCTGPVDSGAAIDTSSAGSHEFTVQASDKAGHDASQTVHYTVMPASAPEISITGPADGATYKVGDSVKAAYTCSDDGSGVRSCAGTLPDGATIDTSTPNTYAFTVSATDNAGHSATATVHYTVAAPPPSGGDQTGPAVSLRKPRDGASYWQGQPVKAHYSCWDDGSGVRSCTGAVPSGSAIDTTRLGVHAFSVTAVDNAGNRTTRTVVYAVHAFRGRAALDRASAALQTSSLTSMRIGTLHVFSVRTQPRHLLRPPTLRSLLSLAYVPTHRARVVTRATLTARGVTVGLRTTARTIRARRARVVQIRAGAAQQRAIVRTGAARARLRLDVSATDLATGIVTRRALTYRVVLP